MCGAMKDTETITLRGLARALFESEMDEEIWEEGDEPPEWSDTLVRAFYRAQATALITRARDANR